jgi:hypothetical protein
VILAPAIEAHVPTTRDGDYRYVCGDTSITHDFNMSSELPSPLMVKSGARQPTGSNRSKVSGARDAPLRTDGIG